VHKIDIHNAFLNGNLSEDVFMTQLPGYSHPKFQPYLKAPKSLLWLKTSSQSLVLKTEY
jgi:hypothetical protein